MALLVAACAVWPATDAAAQVLGQLEVAASNASGGGGIVIDLSEGQWDPVTQTWTWSQDEPVPIEDGGEVVATLLHAGVYLNGSDPEVRVNLGVTAGSSDTYFLLETPKLEIEPLPAAYALARAVATVDLTETQGLGGQAYVIGDPPGSGHGVFQARMNNWQHEFSHLVGWVYANNGGTASVTQRDPSLGSRPVQRDVYDLEARLAFTLTANDVAFVTAVLGPLPEPDILTGDMNCDGKVDNADIPAFVMAISDALAYAAEYPTCRRWAADANGDGAVDSADIPGFLDLLLN